MTEASKSLLGKDTDYSQTYSPSILFPLDRAKNRQSLGLDVQLPFQGEDVWTGFELSWLNKHGKPVVRMAEFKFPASSPFMIESKSFKLYLNSLNHESFDSIEEVRTLIEKDLSNASGQPVSVRFYEVDSSFENSALSGFTCVDELEAEGFEYQPNKSLLKIRPDSNVTEALCSHLLRSNCPVTGQPDWASLYIRYRGPQIEAESFLKYVVSFRQCQDFHEHCVERIFTEILNVCCCESLSVYARYTRRGGLDINPYRTTFDLSAKAPSGRTVRQ